MEGEPTIQDVGPVALGLIMALRDGQDDALAAVPLTPALRQKFLDRDRVRELRELLADPRWGMSTRLRPGRTDGNWQVWLVYAAPRVVDSPTEASVYPIELTCSDGEWVIESLGVLAPQPPESTSS